MNDKPPPRRKVMDLGFGIIIAATLLAAVGVGYQRGWGRVWEITSHNLGFAALLLPKILSGVFVAAAVPMLIPRDRIVGLIGRDSGIRGLVLAMVAGAAIPGGPIMTYPLAAGFLVAGADLGAATAMVTGWSLFNLNRTLIWEFSFLHADFVGMRMLLALPFPILVGLAVRAVTR